VTLVAAGSAVAARTPTLHLVSLTPKVAVVRGLAFRPREHVTLRLVGRVVSKKLTIASRTGSFRVVLARPTSLACGQLLLVAKGSAGSSALARIGPPECNPPGDLNR
jgi:hypothetical protein